jgi:hypothetical protein
MAAEPAVLTLRETATFLRKGQRQTREAAIRGELPECHKIGRDWRCSRVLLERRFPREEVMSNGRADATGRDLEVAQTTAPGSLHPSAV